MISLVHFKKFAFTLSFALMILRSPLSIGTEFLNPREVNDDANASSEPQDCIVLNLPEAISRALNSNRQLLNTLENLTRAQYGLDLAASEFDISITPSSRTFYTGADRGTPEWTIGTGLDFEKKLTSGTIVTLTPSVTKRRKHYLTEIEVNVSQPLLRGLGREYQLSGLFGAQFEFRSAYRTLYLAQVQLIIRTIQNLYELVKAEKARELNRESYQRIRQFYLAAQLKEKIGLSDALDVYRAESELRQAENALKNAEERFEELMDTLRDLLALPLDVSLQIDVPTISTPRPISLDEAVEIALAHRIEIDQSKDDRKENERLSRMAKNDLQPELNLVVNYSNVGRARHFSHSLTGNRENIWEIGLTSAGDFNPMAQSYAYEQTKLAIASASRGIEQAEANVIMDVKKAMRQRNRADEKIRLQEGQIKTAQGELHLAKVKFDRGMADNFNVIQAEKSLRRAELGYWTARIDHVVSEYQMLAAMGLLIDKPHLR